MTQKRHFKPGYKASQDSTTDHQEVDFDVVRHENTLYIFVCASSQTTREENTITTYGKLVSYLHYNLLNAKRHFNVLLNTLTQLSLEVYGFLSLI